MCNASLLLLKCRLEKEQQQQQVGHGAQRRGGQQNSGLLTSVGQKFIGKDNPFKQRLEKFITILNFNVQGPRLITMVLDWMKIQAGFTK